MHQNAIFRQFVDGCGTQAAAARALNRSRATVNRVYHGHLPVSLQIARHIERLTEGRLPAAAVLGLQTPAVVMNEGS